MSWFGGLEITRQKGETSRRSTVAANNYSPRPAREREGGRGRMEERTNCEVVCREKK